MWRSQLSVAAHVAATERLFAAKFPQLGHDLDLRFASSVREDLSQALRQTQSILSLALSLS